jgi:hypothetical protein
VIQAIVVGLLVGAVVCSYLQRRARMVRGRVQHEQDLFSVQALYAEMTAALSSVQMAARDPDSRWLFGLSESRTLTEAWITHALTLERLDPARWEILDRAVKAVEPIYAFASVRAETDLLQQSLAEREQRLRSGIDVLRDMLSPAENG